MSFGLVSGVEVPDLSGINEGYEITGHEKYSVIAINVSSENIEPLFLALSRKVSPPSFLVLEHPTHRDKETELRKSDTDPFHKDVHYLDGIDFDRFQSIWKKCNTLCVNDGSTTFGYGSHGGYDEVFVSKYKIFYIYSTEPEKYETVLKEFQIPKQDRLKTVWDNFTEEFPGCTSTIEIDGKTIFELVEELKVDGLYFHEHRES